MLVPPAWHGPAPVGLILERSPLGAGDLVEGLEGTHKGGVRYPIPSFLTYEPGMPRKYEELLGMQRDERAKAGP